MNTHDTTCDLAALERLLDDRLDPTERAGVERHLDGCASCQSKLEMLAAAPELWEEAAVSLSSAGDWLEADGAESSSPGEGDGPRVEQILRFLSPTDDPRMLGRFGGYEIAGLIGCGGMGIVMKGLDVPLNRYVAIKVLSPHLATSGAARLRFAREARAAAAVVHENVLAIHAVAEANGLPYLVMPYIRGTSLQKRLDKSGPLEAAEVLRIGRQVAAGLAAAHAQGLVHRDIKPANILLEDGVERLKITDFGLARAADDASLTRSGVIAGTPQYMSPEQARGDAVDARSDLFSLGSVLYSLCTGHPPFRAETSFGMLRRITDDQQRPILEINPAVPVWLSGMIDRLLSKSPADRFATAHELALMCEQCLAHLQQPHVVAIPAQLVAGRAVRPGRWKRAVWWTTAVGASVLVAVAWNYLSEANKRRESATNRSAAQTPISRAADGPAPNADSASGKENSTTWRWNDPADAALEEVHRETRRFEQAFSADGALDLNWNSQSERMLDAAAFELEVLSHEIEVDRLESIPESNP